MVWTEPYEYKSSFSGGRFEPPLALSLFMDNSEKNFTLFYKVIKMVPILTELHDFFCEKRKEWPISRIDAL